MKITKIESETPSIFRVTFNPNWVERLFGAKEIVKRYKDTGREFALTKTSVYVDEMGYCLPNDDLAHRLDEFRYPIEPFKPF